MSSSGNVAVIWRDDGVISYIIPPSVLVNTFFAVVLRHEQWLCHLVNELEAVVTPEIVTAVMGTRNADFVTTLKAGLSDSTSDHMANTAFVSRLKQGTPDEFPGMYYGTMHPTELAVLADKIVEVLALSEAMGLLQVEENRRQIGTLTCWLDAAKKFVRPAEEMSALSLEIHNA